MHFLQALIKTNIYIHRSLGQKFFLQFVQILSFHTLLNFIPQVDDSATFDIKIHIKQYQSIDFSIK